MSGQGAGIHLVLFSIEDRRYALPLSVVERVLPMVAVSPLPRGPAVALGVVNVHGTVVPVVDVRLRLGFPPRDFGISSHLLVARTRRRRLALPVDEVFGVSEVASEAVASPDRVLPGIGHVAGIAALPDGLVFVQDLDVFLSLDEEERLTKALEQIER